MWITTVPSSVTSYALTVPSRSVLSESHRGWGGQGTSGLDVPSCKSCKSSEGLPRDFNRPSPVLGPSPSTDPVGRVLPVPVYAGVGHPKVGFPR